MLWPDLPRRAAWGRAILAWAIIHALIHRVKVQPRDMFMGGVVP